MKKYSWIVALLLALSLAFIACPEPKDKDDGKKPDGDKPTVISKGAFNLLLTDNFEYGEGYQGLIDDLKLFPGGKIVEGDVYSMKITFTVSRELEDVLTVGLVDRTPPDGGGDYWIPLSYDAEDDGWELEDDDAPAVAATVEDAAGEATVTKVITFTALHTALTGQANANCIAFETQGAGTPGTANSGTKGTVTLKFTEFLFVKGTAEDLEGDVAPPADGYVPAPVTANEDYTVKLEGLEMKNTEAWTANYQNLWLDLSEAFPADFDIMNYDKYTLEAKFFDADGEEIAVANGLGQTRWALGNAYSGGSWVSGENKGNLGTAASANVGIYDNELLVTPTMLYVQNTSASVAFIEITKITFHWGSSRVVSVSAPPPLADAPIAGSTLVPGLTLDISNFNDTNWAWKATDQGEGYLKGRISAATATTIMALTGGKYQIYWVSANGQPINNGIGAFGGQYYNAGSGGPSNGEVTETRGIVVGEVSALVAETGGNAGQLNLNTYNNGGVVKILFYSTP